MAPTIVVISEEESRSPRWSISSWFSERDSSVFSRAGKWQNARKAAKRCKLGGDAGLHSGMSWYMTTFLMVAETISMGVLTLSYAASQLGMVPACILQAVLGGITTLTGRLYYRFQRRHPEITSLPHALEVASGGSRSVFWIAFFMNKLFLLFVMAGHLILFREAMITFFGDNVCAVVWTGVAFGINLPLTLPKAFKCQSYLCIVSCLSILGAAGTVIIDLGSHRPLEAVTTPFHAVTAPGTLSTMGTMSSFATVCAAVSNIVVSYTGHFAYLAIIPEMKNPDDFPKALYVANGVTVSMYTVIGAVCYALDGQLVDSPVLNALAGAARKVAYGLAIPTIIIAGVIPCSVLAKQCMKLVYRENGLVDEERLNSSRKKPGFYSTILYDTMWCFCILVAWIIALGLANVIPFFNDLLALIGSLVGTWLCLGFPAMFGLYLLYDGVETSSPAPPTSPGSKTRRQTQRALEVWKTWSAKKRFYLGSYLFLLTACIVLMALGLWGSVMGIKQKAHGGGLHNYHPFPCKITRSDGTESGPNHSSIGVFTGQVQHGQATAMFAV